MKTQQLVSLCVAVAILSACGQREPPAPATPATAAAPPPPAETPPAPAETPPAPGATAHLAPTQGNTATGTLTLTADGETVRVSGTLQGLKPNSEFRRGATDGADLGVNFIELARAIGARAREWLGVS